MKLWKPSILMVPQFHPVFLFSWAPPLLLHRFSLYVPVQPTIIPLEPCAVNAEIQHFVLSFHRFIYWNSIKFPYFTDTTKTRVRGWKETQWRGEDRVNLCLMVNETPCPGDLLENQISGGCIKLQNRLIKAPQRWKLFQPPAQVCQKGASLPEVGTCLWTWLKNTGFNFAGLERIFSVKFYTCGSIRTFFNGACLLTFTSYRGVGSRNGHTFQREDSHPIPTGHDCHNSGLEVVGWICYASCKETTHEKDAY